MNRDRFRHYKLDVELLDLHHWTLFDMLNQVHEQDKAQNIEARDSLLSKFFDELDEHMKIEEQLMEKHQYPFREHHKTMHPESTGKLKELKAKIKSGRHDLYVNSNDMSVLLEEHIEWGDRQFADWAKQNNITLSF